MINPVAFEVLGLEVKWYGILIASGVLLAALLCMRREARFGLARDSTVNLVFACLPLAIVFARAYYVAFSWEHYAARPSDIFRLRDGGMAIYGGVLGGMLGGFLYARHAKIPFMKLADFAAPALALGQAVGRWGNFVNQEAFGREITSPAWQFFPAAVFIEREQAYFQATFFYESAWCFLIVAALLLAERRGWFQRTGHEFLWYALMYAVERSVVEGMRSDSLYWGSLRVSQVLSVAVAAAIAVYFIILRYRYNRKRA